MTEEPGIGTRGLPAPPGDDRLRLYVAAQAPNSVRAIDNLRCLRKRCGQAGGETEIVDVIGDPLRALRDGILVTPTLVRLLPLPEVRIIGDLSETTRVAQALGWTEITSDG